jgi:hypothetical protein
MAKPPASLTRRTWLFVQLAAFAPFARAISAPALLVRIDGDFVRVHAPRLQFLIGRTLERLHDGSTVGFLGQLSLSTDGNHTVQSRSIARFALSYDIWEETFSVTRIAQTRRTVAHLSAEAAQDWLVNELTLNTSVVPRTAPFWVRLDLRAEDGRDNLDFIGGSGISLTRMVEVFSRPPYAAQPHWSLEAGPLSLATLSPRVVE